MWIETHRVQPSGISMSVTPHVGVWIETTKVNSLGDDAAVTPHVGVWIETSFLGYYM